MRHEKRVARSPPDDLESELVECDPPLNNFEARLGTSGTDRGPPRDGVPAGGRGVHRRVKRVSVSAAGLICMPRLPLMSESAVALDDLGDSSSQIVHEWRERRSATASRTSVPRA